MVVQVAATYCCVFRTQVVRDRVTPIRRGAFRTPVVYDRVVNLCRSADSKGVNALTFYLTSLLMPGAEAPGYGRPPIYGRPRPLILVCGVVCSALRVP